MDVDINSNINTDVQDGPEHVIGYDEYGFAVFDGEHKPEAERCHRYSRMKDDKEQLIQWEKVLSGWKTTRNCLGIKVQKMIRQGVPHSVRPQLWGELLDIEALRATSSFNYKAQLVGVREQLVDLNVSEYCGADAVGRLYELESAGVVQQEGHISFECLRQILLDLDRSYPTNRLFISGRPDGIEGRASLFRVLAIYARYNPEVSYCQGMSYLGGLLLMVIEDEEKVFWALVSLLERFKYLRGYYDHNMERIQRHVNVYAKLVKQHLPALSSHLNNLGVSPLMFATPWFLCLYTSLPCWETVLAIWDLFMLDGVLTIFRVSLSILEVMEEQILATEDISQLLPMLLHPPENKVEYLSLMPTLYSTHLEDWEVAKLEAVVMEETGITATRKRHCQTRASSSLEPTSKRRHTMEEEPSKPTPAAGPSLFQRFVNIFTPREQRKEMLAGDGPPSARKLARLSKRRQHTSRTRPISTVIAPSSGTPQQQSVCNNPSRHPATPQKHPTPRSGPHKSRTVTRQTSTPKRKQPKQRSDVDAENVGVGVQLRRSPRLHQAPLRDLNAPSTRTLVNSTAAVQYSFKHFTTPKPLRDTQQDGRQSEALPGGGKHYDSPEVEMKSMVSCKSQ